MNVCLDHSIGEGKKFSYLSWKSSSRPFLIFSNVLDSIIEQTAQAKTIPRKAAAAQCLRIRNNALCNLLYPPN